MSSVDDERYPHPTYEAGLPLDVARAPGEGTVYRVQAQHARAAFAGAAADFKRNLKDAAMPSNLARHYPLATAGAAAGVGLIAALILVPSKKQAAAARLRTLEEAIRAEAAAGSGLRGSQPVVRQGSARKLVQLGLRFGKPAAMRFLLGFLSGAGGSIAGQQAAEADDKAGGVDDAIGTEP